MSEPKGGLTWREGLRIVDLYELARQLYCKQCGVVLELNRTIAETQFGLASVLAISCVSCGTTNEVHTGKRKKKLLPSSEKSYVYEVNIKASLDTLILQRKESAVLNFLAILNIPLPTAPISGCNQHKDCLLGDELQDQNETAENHMCTGDSVTNSVSLFQGDLLQNQRLIAHTETHQNGSENVPASSNSKKTEPNLPCTHLHNLDDAAWSDNIEKGLEKDKGFDLLSHGNMLSKSPSGHQIAFSVDVPTSFREPDTVSDDREMKHSLKGIVFAVDHPTASGCKKEKNQRKKKSPRKCQKTHTAALALTRSQGKHSRSEAKTGTRKREKIPVTDMNKKTLRSKRNCAVSLRTYSKSLRQTRQSVEDSQRRNDCVKHSVNMKKRCNRKQCSASPVLQTCAFRCPVCEKNFSSSRGMTFHLKRMHRQSDAGQTKSRSELETLSVDRELTEDKQDTDSANEGRQGVRTESSMEKSAQQATSAGHSPSNKFCIKTTQQNTNQTKKKSLGTHRFECKECSRCFFFSAEYSTHMLKEHGVRKPYICKKCPESYSTENQLKVHRKSHIAEEPDGAFECTVCLKIFPNGRRLRAHRTTHSREERLKPLKRYKCECCGEEFNKNYFLQIHLRYHTGEKPYQCFNCDAKFVTKPQRTTHFKKCIAKQKAYLCELCGGRFGSACTLRKHERVHTGEKPHKCRYCEQSFGRRNTLKIHERQHTGERPYVCDQCAAAFKQRVSLVSHMRNNHNINATLYSQPREGPRYTYAQLTAGKSLASGSGQKNRVVSDFIQAGPGRNIGAGSGDARDIPGKVPDTTVSTSPSFVPQGVLMPGSIPEVPVSIEESTNIITLAHAASVLAPVSSVVNPYPASNPVVNINYHSTKQDLNSSGNICQSEDVISLAPVARFVQLAQDLPAVANTESRGVLPVVQKDDTVTSLQPQDSNVLMICSDQLPSEYSSIYYN